MNAHPDHSCQTSGRWYLNCHSCLKETRFQTGYHIVRTVDRSSLLWELRKKSEIDRVLRGVRTCCWNVRMDASWIESSRHSGGSGWRDTSSGRMMLGLSGVGTEWHVFRTDGTVTDGHLDGMARSFGRLTGNWKSSDSEAFLNSRIPMEHRYTQVILSKHRMRPKY
jgi:hypothetical protein